MSVKGGTLPDRLGPKGGSVPHAAGEQDAAARLTEARIAAPRNPHGSELGTIPQARAPIETPRS